MSFVSVKKENNNSQVMKLVDLIDIEFTGRYLRKEDGTYSIIYIFDVGNNTEMKIFGSSSLNAFMNDSLIGKVLLITCKQIKYTDRGVPYGIADVKVWLDDNDLLINPSPDPEDDREIPEYALTIPEECN